MQPTLRFVLKLQHVQNTKKNYHNTLKLILTSQFSQLQKLLQNEITKNYREQFTGLH